MHCGKQNSAGKMPKKWSRPEKLSLINADGGCYGNVGAKRGTGLTGPSVSREEEEEEVVEERVSWC